MDGRGKCYTYYLLLDQLLMIFVDSAVAEALAVVAVPQLDDCCSKTFSLSLSSFFNSLNFVFFFLNVHFNFSDFSLAFFYWCIARCVCVSTFM